MRLANGAGIWAGFLFAAAGPCAFAQDARATDQTITLTSIQLFELAEAARTRGDLKVAEGALRALTNDPDRSTRNEARFRLAMLFASQAKHKDAAVLLRRILDDEPGAQRVRLELARVLESLNDDAGARRVLREAQAAGLPPDVARMVDRYSAALRARKRLGASFELTIAPDTNINRATRSDTLGTVLGDFTLDPKSKARSGIGLAARGQAYYRVALSPAVGLLVRASAAGDLYRDNDFNDQALALSAGPEIRLGRRRLAVEAGFNWRWLAGRPYATTIIAGGNYLHPLDRTSVLRATAGFGIISNKRNRLQGGQSYALSVGYERALSGRAGIGVTVSADRQSLRDPSYSTTSGLVTLLGYHEIGQTTLAATLGYGRTEADRRLAILPARRADDLYRATLALTFRRLQVGPFSPIVRVTAERNLSSIEIFDYRRVRTEIGITKAY